MADELGVVTPDVPEVGGCPVLTRVNAFLVDQGTSPTLEFVIRDSKGNPVDLSPLFGTSVSSSVSASSGDGVVDYPAVMLRIKEELGRGLWDNGNPVWEVEATVVDPAGGVVQADVPEDVTQNAGIYRLNWGVYDAAGKLRMVSKALLSVERSLFVPLDIVQRDLGPLTIQSLRGYLRDSSPAENLRLDSVEFGDEEILLAFLRPVEYYNDQPPPIDWFTTRTFPSRFHWSRGTMAQLYEMAAASYRRNKQKLQAGGVMDDDLNRDQEYMGEAQRLWAEFVEWVPRDKVMRNARLVVGSIGSVYGARYSGW
jgi:hypothetical protein